MKTKKRSPLFFTYTDCDAFSEYLRQQSLCGWHLKEFRFGMVFEAGKPQERYYDVEVFPQGMETDLRPGEEAEEYSGYCEAAGWRLIDGIRKFCVFEKISADAVPIVTPMERLENIRRAQLQLSGKCFLSYVIQFFLMLANLSWNQDALFINLFVFLFLLVTVLGTIELVHGILIAAGLHRKKCLLLKGEIPVYGTRQRHWHIRDLVIAGIVLALCADYAFMQKNPAVFWYTAMYLGLILAVQMLLAWFRPDRNGRMLAALFLGVGLVFVLCMSVMLSMYRSSKRSSADLSFAYMPFTLSDFRQPEGEAVHTDYGYSESILGSITYCSMEYETLIEKVTETGIETGIETEIKTEIETEIKADKTNLETVCETADLETVSDNSGSVSDVLTYRIYQSRYPWVLDQVWKDGMGRAGDNWHPCAQEWGAKEAVSDGRISYLVRYDDLILDLVTNRTLTQAQIKIITEKMGVL